jgi:hypothetical protein
LTIKSEVWRYLDSQPRRRISGWELWHAIHDIRGEWPYPCLLLRYAREYSDASGGRFDCVDRVCSIYQFDPGEKIAEAIID